ncbi:MAG: GNAT family N-acetyltransferase [Mycobacterium sp.]
MSVAVDIRAAVAADVDPAARTLAAAFDRYAWTRWSIPEDGYGDRLEQLQRLYLGYALEQGVVLVSDNLRGVIALLPPTAAAPTAEFQDQVARLHGQRLAAVAQVATPAQPENAWNLATLGVHPDSQGAGLGGAMISAGLAAVDQCHSGDTGVALETSDERNVRLYERSGFRVTATTLIDQGPTVYSMLRCATA